MNEHICEACFQPSHQHDSRCGCGKRHWPPLCCPKCPCGSYDEAHGYCEGSGKSSIKTHAWTVAGVVRGECRECGRLLKIRSTTANLPRHKSSDALRLTLVDRAQARKQARKQARNSDGA